MGKKNKIFHSIIKGIVPFLAISIIIMLYQSIQDMNIEKSFLGATLDISIIFLSVLSLICTIEVNSSKSRLIKVLFNSVLIFLLCGISHLLMSIYGIFVRPNLIFDYYDPMSLIFLLNVIFTIVFMALFLYYFFTLYNMRHNMFFFLLLALLIMGKGVLMFNI